MTPRKDDWPFPHRTQYFGAIGQAFAVVLRILVIPGLSGCVNASLAAARSKLSDGQYAAAHEQLMAAAGQPQKLSARERREVLDDLCLIDVKIGTPSYSLAEQQRACARAASQPGSSSGPTLAQVEAAQRAALAAEVTSALKANDVMLGEDAITRYRSIPGADPRVVAGWSRQIWVILNRRDSLAQKRSGHQLDAAISKLARAYPQMKEMKESAFRHWILDNASVDGHRWSPACKYAATPWTSGYRMSGSPPWRLISIVSRKSTTPGSRDAAATDEPMSASQGRDCLPTSYDLTRRQTGPKC